MITQQLVDDMEVYAKKFVEELNAMDDESAKEFAIKELDSMGLLDENKRPKEQIVTGDFFGW